AFQHLLDFHVVSRKECVLQLLRAVFEAAFLVGFSPEADEEQASGKVQLLHVFVLEEPRLNIARSGHHAASRMMVASLTRPFGVTRACSVVFSVPSGRSTVLYLCSITPA